MDFIVKITRTFIFAIASAFGFAILAFPLFALCYGLYQLANDNTYGLIPTILGGLLIYAFRPIEDNERDENNDY